ncbi:MAG: tRNA pseudouridine(55) synthase TruB [Firmicutes bacterium]|nr:tRNA pseudouridine(55) synthase TruB [Bacillota bacterium]
MCGWQIVTRTLENVKGLLNINKPTALTSSDVVSKVRKILGTRAVGHMGTLDPQGTGVLLIGVGKGCRLFDFFLSKDKEYEAEFAFGYTTDTLDKDGTIIATTDVIPDKASILGALEMLCGQVEQLPPIYSAKSIDGKRAYEIARKGEIPQLKTASVRIDSIKLLEQTAQYTYKFLIACSSGTYIRSICRDLAASLSSLACMTSIHRTKAGEYTDKTAVTLEQLSELKQSAVIPIEIALRNLPRIDFVDSDYQRILNGIKIDCDTTHKQFTVYSKNELFGIGTTQNNKLKITSFLKD